MQRFQCKVCAKELSSKQALKKHESKCNGLNVLQCHKCHKWFSSAQGKYKHVNNVTCEPVTIDNSVTNNDNTVNNDHSVTNNNDNRHYTTNNNIDNSVHNTNVVVLNTEFGKENVEHLLQNKDLMSSIINTARTAVTLEEKGQVLPKFLEKIHFDPEHPENHTIKMTNSRGNTVQVRRNNGWEREMADTAIDAMNRRANQYLESHAEVGDESMDAYLDSTLYGDESDEPTLKRQRQTAKNLILNRTRDTEAAAR